MLPPTSITNQHPLVYLIQPEVFSFEPAFEATELDYHGGQLFGIFSNFTPLTNTTIEMSNETNALAWALPQSATAFVRRFHQALEQAGIDLIPAQVMFLVHISTNDDPVQTLMATQMGKDKSAVLRQVDLFEQRGWVERKIDPNDRRRKRLLLTPAGEEVLARGRGVMEMVFGHACEGIPTADIAICVRVLTQLRERVMPLLQPQQQG